MKGYELLDALGGVDAKYISRAAEGGRKRNAGWVRWGALAACVCIIAAGTVLWARSRAGTAPVTYDGPDPSAQTAPSVTPRDGEAPADGKPADTAPAVTAPDDRAAAKTEDGEGIYIPAVNLPDEDFVGAADMIGLVVYKGGIYTQTESYFGEDAERIDGLVGDCLGRASGSIDEWSSQDEYAVELASNISGDVYSVKGYDTSFRVCIRNEVQGPDGEPQLWIEFLDRFNGVTISTGADLYEKRLRLKDRVETVRWQSHEDWNWNLGGVRDAELPEGLWERFLAAVDEGKFVFTWMPEGDFYEGKPRSTIFDTPNQTHLIIAVEDGTTVRMRLVEGGYVSCETTGWWYFVKIPGQVFDAVYDACGGTHAPW